MSKLRHSRESVIFKFFSNHKAIQKLGTTSSGWISYMKDLHFSLL